jgi:ABC-type branched-subunit amino acid transport system substrate-binding protein
MQEASCRGRWVALVFFLLLLLTSCVVPRMRLPGAVRPTVKIGLVAPFEGRYRYVGYDVIYAVRLALREANAAAGGAGYSVELVAYDDGADPAMAIEQARKLAADPEVIAAIGHFREETTSAAVSIYVETGIPLVAPAVFSPALTDDADIYRLGPSAEVAACELLERLDVLEWPAAALVTSSGPLGAALDRGTLACPFQIRPSVSPQDQDGLQEVASSGVGAVFCDADPVTAGEVVVALRDAGWEGQCLGGPELAATDFYAVAGDSAEGAIFVTPWPFPAQVPGGSGFVVDYRAVSNGVSPGPLSLPAYEATWVLLEALGRDVAARGTPTRQGVGAALLATKRKGLLGSIAFDEGRGWNAAPWYEYRIGAGGAPEFVR